MATKPQRHEEVEETSSSYVSQDQEATVSTREALLQQASVMLDGTLLSMQMSSLDIHPQTLQRWVAELEVVQQVLHRELGEV